MSKCKQKLNFFSIFLPLDWLNPRQRSMLWSVGQLKIFAADLLEYAQTMIFLLIKLLPLLNIDFNVILYGNFNSFLYFKYGPLDFLYFWYSNLGAALLLN